MVTVGGARKKAVADDGMVEAQATVVAQIEIALRFRIIKTVTRFACPTFSLLVSLPGDYWTRRGMYWWCGLWGDRLTFCVDHELVAKSRLMLFSSCSRSSTNKGGFSRAGNTQNRPREYGTSLPCIAEVQRLTCAQCSEPTSSRVLLSLRCAKRNGVGAACKLINRCACTHVGSLHMSSVYRYTSAFPLLQRTRPPCQRAEEEGESRT